MSIEKHAGLILQGFNSIKDFKNKMDMNLKEEQKRKESIKAALLAALTEIDFNLTEIEGLIKYCNINNETQVDTEQIKVTFKSKEWDDNKKQLLILQDGLFVEDIQTYYGNINKMQYQGKYYLPKEMLIYMKNLSNKLDKNINNFIINIF